jgi:hypothetical protein
MRQPCALIRDLCISYCVPLLHFLQRHAQCYTSCAFRLLQPPGRRFCHLQYRYVNFMQCASLPHFIPPQRYSWDNLCFRAGSRSEAKLRLQQVNIFVFDVEELSLEVPSHCCGLQDQLMQPLVLWFDSMTGANSCVTGHLPPTLAHQTSLSTRGCR